MMLLRPLFRFIPRLPPPLFPFTFVTTAHSLIRPLTDPQLRDQKLIKEILKTPLQRRTMRSQRGLFHGKRIKTGNKSCFSEKKSRRTWKPNVVKKWLWSEVLGKGFRLNVTTKMLRCMRKYGGFDNYILLTKPEKLDSIYGEYLRALMLRKLNDKQFTIGYIRGTARFKFPYTHRRRRYRKDPFVHPLNQRNTDMSYLKLKVPSEMNRKELSDFKEIVDLESNLEDIQTNHPVIKRLVDMQEQQAKILEPDRQLVLEEYNRKKSKKNKALLNELLDEGVEEFHNPQGKEYVNLRKMRQNKSKK